MKIFSIIWVFMHFNGTWTNLAVGVILSGIFQTRIRLSLDWGDSAVSRLCGPVCATCVNSVYCSTHLPSRCQPNILLLNVPRKTYGMLCTCETARKDISNLLGVCIASTDSLVPVHGSCCVFILLITLTTL